LLLDRGNWPSHRPWLIFCLAATLAASVWFFAESRGSAHWPSGSSLPGLTFGVLGGLIILFELLLWLRKKFRVWRVGRAKVWMRAHIWLGMLCVPLLIYHSGFRLGGTLSTALMVLLLVVIASGVWGLALQQLVPRQMLEDLPAETIYSQIDYLSNVLLVEAERMVRATCGPEPGEEVVAVGALTPSGATTADHVVVGAVRSVGRVHGKVVQAQPAASPVPESEPLRAFFRTTVTPFLRGDAPDSPLSSAAKIQTVFDGMRTRLPPAAHGCLNVLQDACQQRRQWTQQARLHFWLHNWLWVHFPLSVALVVLMVVHVWVALKYW
jgi:hypothetical protein